MITYIGNKRKLLSFINNNILLIKENLDKSQIKVFDGFSGSGCVSRLLKYHASKLISNDLELYSEIINKCYLANKSEINFNLIKSNIEYLNKMKLHEMSNVGLIEKSYAPMDDFNIQKGERVFYTNTNAKIIDNIRKMINNHNTKYKPFYIAPLLVESSIHTNTSGIFKGFHKKNGIGHFGGKGNNALKRIKGEINLSIPILSEVETKVDILRTDTNKLVDNINDLDLAYYDPPYNQHPYGSNYFMLNLIAEYNKNIEIQHGVSGITQYWNKSEYNRRGKASRALDYLIDKTDSEYILLSYNNEGIIPSSKVREILEKYGKVELKTKEYNTYRGSRNLNNRNIKVEEQLWLIRKSQ